MKNVLGISLIALALSATPVLADDHGAKEQTMTKTETKASQPADAGKQADKKAATKTATTKSKSSDKKAEGTATKTAGEKDSKTKQDSQAKPQ